MLHRVKKHNDINEGKWIGVGGHAEGQESPEECLLREVKEETGLTLTSYKLRGLVTFISDKCEPELMCVFTAKQFIILSLQNHPLRYAALYRITASQFLRLI